ncbi:deoxyribodipyrimidine photo-lyase [Leptolyngbya sp. 15MV]|nr:deoxyribodipyrimidine photo-lyase [Leptolyngbya sp. 15MV]
MRPLVWLRTDLRADDNLALHAAARDATSGCLAVFLLSPGEWRAHDWAPVKVDLVLRTLAALSADLAALNIPLLIAHADEPTQIPVVLKALAHEHACDALYYNREYEVNERRRDADVERTLGSVGLQIRAFDDQVMAPPGSVRTGAGGWYTVFSPARRSRGIEEVEGRRGPGVHIPTRNGGRRRVADARHDVQVHARGGAGDVDVDNAAPDDLGLGILNHAHRASRGNGGNSEASIKALSKSRHIFPSFRKWLFRPSSVRIVSPPGERSARRSSRPDNTQTRRERGENPGRVQSLYQNRLIVQDLTHPESTDCHRRAKKL